MIIKVSLLLIPLLTYCIAQDAKATTIDKGERNDSCKTTCPSMPQSSKCQFKCGKRSILDCSDSGLDHISRAELDKWATSLTKCKIEIFSLRLDSNSIERLDQIHNLPGVEAVHLKRNKMTDIEPKSFYFMTKMKELDLSENLLTGETVRPDIFIGPTKKEEYEPLAIETLDLSHNNIHSLASKTFQHLPNLRELYLHNNPLKVVDEHTITAITSAPLLEVASLTDCGLQKVALPKESKLKKLFLNNNNIRVIPEELPANLTYLNLNGNPIAALPRCAFCHVPKLQELAISGMLNLRCIESEAFRGLPELQILQCDYNSKLEEIHPMAFVDENRSQNWTLTQVSFAWCSIKKLHRSLLPWNRIATLDLRGNPLSCDADDWSPDAVRLLQRSEKAFGLLVEQESCNSWRLQESRHPASLGVIAQTLLLSVSAAVVVVSAFALLILSVRKAQAESNRSPHLMVHYRRATRNQYPL